MRRIDGYIRRVHKHDSADDHTHDRADDYEDHAADHNHDSCAAPNSTDLPVRR
ncbi:hypothetical protein HQP04_17860 [Rhodococcus fascians]|nr:hypothetical protein [Rhodococcus fascians]MBY4023891.1 hypothetical protein [Rhodococcus fascians]